MICWVWKKLQRLAKKNGMRWYGHILRKNHNDGLRRPKMTWRRQVVKLMEEMD